MYKLPSTAWDKSVDGSIFQQFPSLTDQINSTMHDMNHFNYFLANIDTPWAIIKQYGRSCVAACNSGGSDSWYCLILQLINIKLMPTAATAGGENDQMARQMKP